MKLHSAIFYSKDLANAIAFYKDVVGLKVDYIQEGRFASFNLENGNIGIKQAKEERETPGHQTAFIEVEDIEAMYKSFQQKDIKFSKELTKEDWAVNFSFLDPDGNKIQFISKAKG